jgi:hypothetical protein
MVMEITLKPTSSRLKRLIHDFGARWVIVRGPVSMPCFSGQLGVMASPLSDPKKFSNFEGSFQNNN